MNVGSPVRPSASDPVPSGGTVPPAGPVAAGGPLKALTNRLRALGQMDGWTRTGRKAPPPVATEGNHLELHLDANGFRKILQTIESARHQLALEMFIFKDDATGHAVADRLIEKARQGVEVRVLVDTLGTLGSGKVLDRLRKGGVTVERYFPGILPFLGVNITHRKLVLADGKVGMTGGMNIADEYAKTWHDLMVSVEGPAVADLERTFQEDWRRAGGKPFAFRNVPRPTRPDGSSVALMTTAPEHSRRGASIRNGIYDALSSARQEVWLTYPYLSDNRLVEQLQAAARRGVKVHVILPAPETSDSFLYKLLNEASARQLAGAGVEVRYLNSPRFSHAKALVIDGTWSTMGSANGDARSYDANQELNLAITDPAFARTVRERLFDRWWPHAEPYDAEYRRARWYERPLLWMRAALSSTLELFDFMA